MGQRLNIEITKNGNVLANSYYHYFFKNNFNNKYIGIIE